MVIQRKKRKLKKVFRRFYTRHNSADSVPTPNLVCIKEVAIRATFYCLNNLQHLHLKACLHIHDFWLRCRYDSPRFVKSSCTVVIRSRTVVNRGES